MGKWEMVRLGNVASVEAGGTPSRTKQEYWNNGTIPWVKISDFRGGTVSKTEELITQKGFENSSAKMFPVGTILFTIFATLGEVSVLNIPASTNQAIAGIIPNDDRIDLMFLVSYLKSIKKTILEMGRGVAQNNINLSILRSQRIPLPPLPVQQQIADVLGRASALIEKRKAQIEKLDLLVKSQFIEMFGDPVTNPKGWEVGTIRDLVSDVKYGTSKPATKNGKYIYLRMNNITYRGSMDLSNLKYINIGDEEIEKYIVRKGDVLFNRTNSKELVGKTTVFKEETPMIIAGYIIRVRTNEKAHPEYISAFLNSRYGKNTLLEMCKTIVGQANINAQELQDIKIPLTPIQLQTKFAEFVYRVEAQKSLLQQSLTKLERNYKSLMQKCFRGEIF